MRVFLHGLPWSEYPAGFLGDLVPQRRPPARIEARIGLLKPIARPILCTEYMARPAGSRFDPSLAIFREGRSAAYNWGFVDGKAQTSYPWDSWKKPYPAEPPVWFHDIFRKDGTPYDSKEVDYIRKLTGKAGP